VARLLNEAASSLVRLVEPMLGHDDGKYEEGQEAEEPALQQRSIRTHTGRLWHERDPPSLP
jgi:hypothetical protein